MGVLWSNGPPSTHNLQREATHRVPVIGLPLWFQQCQQVSRYKLSNEKQVLYDFVAGAYQWCRHFSGRPNASTSMTPAGLHRCSRKCKCRGKMVKYSRLPAVSNTVGFPICQIHQASRYVKYSRLSAMTNTFPLCKICSGILFDQKTPIFCIDYR